MQGKEKEEYLKRSGNMVDRKEANVTGLYQYKGKVTRVVDADTVDAALDLGFGIIMHQRFRLDGYDAPETWRPRNELEREHGEKATKRAVELLLDKDIIIRTSKVPGIYGRYGAVIWLPDGRGYAAIMIMEGFAKKESY
jgi:endonuclease YncB( thermonuclease family)